MSIRTTRGTFDLPASVGSIVILTGAGVSAESGVPTFRGPDGLWEGERIEDVATPEAFARDPLRVQRFYDQRRARLADVAPNPAHRALGRFDALWPGELVLVTQNVDDLHERGGAHRLVHMHGELTSALCLSCGARQPCPGPLADHPACAVCHAPALRPDIVWFGELPYQMDRIEAALATADLFVSIGTSGQVWPAAGFVDLARRAGAFCLELNLDSSMTSDRFHQSLLGPAGRLVPDLVEALLQASPRARA
jgi:NAD-dependent deacetylase